MEEGEGRGGEEGRGREGRGRGGLPLSRSEKFLVEALVIVDFHRFTDCHLEAIIT